MTGQFGVKGSVTIGETDENTFSSIKKIKSNGITLGIDKIRRYKSNIWRSNQNGG
jgi:hypothetical protein